MLTFAAAVGVRARAARSRPVIGIALLFLLFVPLEKLFALRKQRVFRPGLLTDLTHFLVNNVLSTVAAIALVVVAAIPVFWIRRFDLVGNLSTEVAVALAVVLVAVGNYWGHRLTHQVPFLWRFHSVHHSIEQMDWVASGRLHPLDSGVHAGVHDLPAVPARVRRRRVRRGRGVHHAARAVPARQRALALPRSALGDQHPEWHHWHHAIDADARDKNFGLPVVDKIFGTAYLPKGRRPTGFGMHDRRFPPTATCAISRTRSPRLRGRRPDLG